MDCVDGSIREAWPDERVDRWAADPASVPHVLDVQGLGVRFAVQDEVVSAVSDVSLTIDAGEIVGVVGESGCGKSTLAMAIMGLLGSTARVTGQVRLQGRDLAHAHVRGATSGCAGDRMSMIFQDPLTSLDPAFGIGEPGGRDHPARTARCRQAEAQDTGHGVAGVGRHPAAAGTATTIRRIGCRVACASAWSSPRRSPTIPRCSSRTSLPPRST